MTIRHYQATFDAGEISPQMLGRVELEKRGSGLSTALNVISLAHGPVERRPGLEYIGALKDSSEKGRLIPFEHSSEDASILVVNDGRVRFYRNGGVIVLETTDTAAWVTATAYIVGDFVDNDGSVYVCTAGHTSGATDEPGTGANWTDYWDQDDTYEVVHTYTEAELPYIDHAQSADTIFLANENHKQAKLLRTDHNDWALSDLEHEDGPFIAANVSDTTLALGAMTGTGVALVASADLFEADDVGRLVAILKIGVTPTAWVTATAYAVGDLRENTVATVSDNYICIQAHTSGASTEPGLGDDWPLYWAYDEKEWAIVEITTVTDAQNAVVTVLDDSDHTTATNLWMLGAWSDTTGYPKSVVFANERLVWGGSTTYPSHIWLSKVSEYTSFAKDNPITDDSAITAPLQAGKLNAIQWVRFPRRLTAGTDGAEWWLTNSTGSGPITASSGSAVPASGHGSSSVKPVALGNILVFLQKHDKVVRELFYEYEKDSFAGDELTLMAEHLTREYGITKMAFQRSPYRVLWCVRADGKLLGCTHYREHKITGWHVHETDGWFEDVATIPGDGDDEVWFIVKRYIDGSYVRYIERMSARFIETDTNNAKFSDSFLTLDNRQDIVSINTSTDVVTVTGHGISDGETVRFRVEDDPNVTAGTEGSLDTLEFEVSDGDANTFKCKDDEGEYVDFSDYTTIWALGDNTIAENITAVSGLSHLEGKDVDILADGIAATGTVSSGSLTLETGASLIHVGLHYDSDVETITPYMDFKSGSSMGLTKRAVSATVKLYQTVGMEVGPDEDNLVEQQFADDDVPAGQSAPLFTGEWEVTFEDDDSTEAKVFIRQAEPLPMTILGVETDIEIELSEEE